MKKKRPTWFKFSEETCTLLLAFNDNAVGKAVRAAAKYFLNNEREYISDDAARGIYTLLEKSIDNANEEYAARIADGMKGAAKKKATLSPPEASLTEENRTEENRTERDANQPRPPTLEEITAYAKAEKLDKVDCEIFYLHYQSLGWEGIKDWKPLLKKWDYKDRKKPVTSKVVVPDTQRSKDWDALFRQDCDAGLR